MDILHSDSSKESTYNCEVCEKSFARKDYLRVHMKTHNARGSTECTICHKTVLHLQKHVESIHEVKSKLKCDKCDFTTKRLSDLTKHSKRHINASNVFKCDICDSELWSKFGLALHMSREHNKHDKDFKPSKCDICGKVLKRSYNLRLHMKSMHPDQTIKNSQ